MKQDIRRLLKTREKRNAELAFELSLVGDISARDFADIFLDFTTKNLYSNFSDIYYWSLGRYAVTVQHAWVGQRRDGLTINAGSRYNCCLYKDKFEIEASVSKPNLDVYEIKKFITKMIRLHVEED